MNGAVIYVHGKGGDAAEAEHYKPLFPDHDMLGFDYRAGTPWEAKDEFTAYFDTIGRRYSSIILIANSLGAFFAMSAGVSHTVIEAYLISPVVDMEKLITDMMTWSGVTEDELRRRKEITTPFGETLSWDYLCYVRENPVKWDTPTHILYGEKDHLTSPDTISAFAASVGATLDVMPGGEHWFHTEEQMAYLDRWISGEKRRAVKEASVPPAAGYES